MKHKREETINNFLFKKHISDKGNILYYAKSDTINPINPDESIDNQCPTKLVFYFNFGISMAMMDFIESYGIVSDLELTNYRKQLICYPLAEFDYKKIDDLFLDLMDQFEI